MVTFFMFGMQTLPSSKTSVFFKGSKFKFISLTFKSFCNQFLVIFIMYKLNLFAKDVRERILIVQVPEDFNYEKEFENLFKKYFTDTGLISIETVSKEGLIELIYSVSLKSRFKSADFLKEIRIINENRKVSLVEGQQQVDL